MQRPTRTLPRRLVGLEIERVRRHGKYLLADLDRGLTLISHLGMSGCWRFHAEAPAHPSRHAHVRVAFRDVAPLWFEDPRRFGLACHLGLWLGIPCFGCAKTRLIGTYKDPGRKAGSVAPLKDKDDVIGQVVRTKAGVKPVFVSVGYKIDLRSAVELVLATCRGYRLPEPTRQAHLHVNALRRRG